MKLSHKLVMVSAVALMSISPLALAGQNANLTVNAASKKATTKTNKIVLSKNAYIYDKNGKQIKNYSYQGFKSSYIGKGSELNYSATKTIKGVLYYQIAANAFVKAANVANADSKKATKSAKPTVTTKSAVLTKNAYVYDKDGKRIASAKTLKTGTTIKYFSTKTIAGKSYYYLGSGKYVKTANTKKVSTPKVRSIALIKNAYVYDKNGKRIKNVKTLKKGTKIKYVGTKEIDGTNYYDLGNNQYVKAANVKNDEPTVQDTWIQLIKNSIVYDENGVATSEDSIVKGPQYQALAAKKINDKWYYQIGDNQWIKAVNATLVSGPSLIPEDELPNTSNTSASASEVVATWNKTAALYNAKGEIEANQTFGQGHAARVDQLVYIWLKSENKAVLFYRLVSDNTGYVKAGDVSVSGSITPANTPQDAADAVLPATGADKVNLINAINAGTSVKNSDAYKLSEQILRSAYDIALANAQKVNGSTTATVNDVKAATAALSKAQAALNGKKVQVANMAQLTSDEVNAIVKVAAAANNVNESAIHYANNAWTIDNIDGTQRPLDVTNYATSLPAATTAVINN